MVGHADSRDTPQPAQRDVRRAWLAVAALPVAFLLAMFVGEGLISAQGYESGSTEPLPIGPVLLASAPALVILVAPGLIAVLYGRRARREGNPGGMLPGWIGGVIAAATVLLNALALVIGR